MPRDYDVVIIGAGMVGASLACALAPSGLKSAIIESIELSNTDQSSYDDRGITLSPSSKRILEYIGVWQQVQQDVFPIKKIHVSEQGRFGFAHLDANQTAYAELGHVVVARSLGQALHKQLKLFENITLLCPAELKHFQRVNNQMQVEVVNKGNIETISAGLLVGADGNNSLVRRLAGINMQEHDFKQTAIVVNVTTQKPNHATAYERFTSHGPVALLPIGNNKSVLVFTVSTDDAKHSLSMSDKQFINKIEKEFGRRLGRIEQIGNRRAYPIIFSEATEQYQEQLVLLGNSAHVIHPNAAQGFNLGLRDVAGLAESISTGIKKGIDINDVMLLENYLKSRITDQKRVMRFTNGLANTFYNKWPLLNATRNLAMLIVDVIPDLKASFVETSMGLAGEQPRIVRGLSL